MTWEPWEVMVDCGFYALHRRSSRCGGAVEVRVWVDGAPRVRAVGETVAGAWRLLVMSLVRHADVGRLPACEDLCHDGSCDPVRS